MKQITLKAARVNVGLTQKEAAKELKISKKTLCNWEKGTTTPKVKQIDSICALYNVNYNQLIFLPQNPL